MEQNNRSFLHEQFHQPAAHPRVDDRLNLLVGSIRQVGQSPASISQNIWVAAKQQPGQNTETGTHLETGHGLTSQAGDVTVLVTGNKLTLVKSGGGFFPRHRLDRAHTAFRVVVRRLDFSSSLNKTKSWVHDELNRIKETNKQTTLTAAETGGRHSSTQSLCTLNYLLLCSPRPKRPETQNKSSDLGQNHSSFVVCPAACVYVCVFIRLSVNKILNKSLDLFHWNYETMSAHQHPTSCKMATRAKQPLNTKGSSSTNLR